MKSESSTDGPPGAQDTGRQEPTAPRGRALEGSARAPSCLVFCELLPSTPERARPHLCQMLCTMPGEEQGAAASAPEELTGRFFKSQYNPRKNCWKIIEGNFNWPEEKSCVLLDRVGQDALTTAVATAET